MTGYGRGEASRNGAKLTVEISTVNRKQAELSLYLPRELDALESRARDEINSRISRGRIVARVGLSATDGDSSKVKLDAALAKRYAREYRKLAKELKLQDDLGIDTMHMNLHKTFSTPHGGGGPGAGPVVFSEALAPYAPVPWVVHGDDGFELVEEDAGKAFGRMKAFHGQMGMFVRAMAYMKSHGADGLKQVSEDAVLNANYVRVGLQDLMSLPFGERWCMHEVLFDDSFLKDTGVTTCT